MSFLSGRVDKASADNFDLIRAVGEMSWVLPGVPGWDDLFVYESSLNRMVEEMPAICLYGLQKFGARMLVQVLQTHPKVLLDGTVIDNPHYLRPAQYPAARLAEASRYPMVSVGSHGDEDRTEGDGRSPTGELRVVAGVAAGMTNRAIATKLRVSRHTVDAHLKHVYHKLDIHTRAELTVLALQHHLSMG